MNEIHASQYFLLSPKLREKHFKPTTSVHETRQGGSDEAERGYQQEATNEK
jgi:hypothetical protein